jgi:hypothetical protein
MRKCEGMMGEMDADTIGLIVLIIAIGAFFIATKVQEHRDGNGKARQGDTASWSFGQALD